MPEPQTKQVPVRALRVPIGTVQFAAKDSDGRIPITMRARSAEPVSHWYFGKIYHDFEGMTHKPTIPADYCHWSDQVLGFLNVFKVDADGLEVSGYLVPFQDDDRASEVTMKARSGVPYEASIDFSGDDTLYEELGPQHSATVNGRQVQGPALIVRKWSLRGVAVCPYGMDANTSAQLSETDRTVSIHLLSREEPMTTPTPGAPAAAPAAAPATQQAAPPAAPAPAAQQAQAEAPKPDDSRQKYAAELKRYTDKFGAENGTKWFTEGKSWEQALEAHTDALQQQFAAQKTENDTLKGRLAAANVGEEKPAQFNQDKKDQPDAADGRPSGKFAALGPSLSKFAESIKLPAAK